MGIESWEDFEIGVSEESMLSESFITDDGILCWCMIEGRGAQEMQQLTPEEIPVYTEKIAKAKISRHPEVAEYVATLTHRLALAEALADAVENERRCDKCTHWDDCDLCCHDEGDYDETGAALKAFREGEKCLL